MGSGCVNDRVSVGGIWFGWLGLVGSGGTNWLGVFWFGLVSLIKAFSFSWYPLSLGDGFIFGMNLGFPMRLALVGFAGGLGGGNDLFLMRSDLRMFTMASSFSMGVVSVKVVLVVEETMKLMLIVFSVFSFPFPVLV